MSANTVWIWIETIELTFYGLYNLWNSAFEVSVADIRCCTKLFPQYMIAIHQTHDVVGPVGILIEFSVYVVHWHFSYIVRDIVQNF